MKRAMKRSITLVAFAVSAACSPEPEPAPADARSAPTTAQTAQPVSASAEPTPAAAPTADAVQDPSCDATVALNQLDPRQPVPLQPMMAWHQKQNMQQHLVAVQQIVDAVARDDWDAAATAARSIGTSPQMQQMCQHMGMGAQGFTELALDFHRRADGIAEAATQRDATAVLRATSHTLQACTACHASYRQDVVDAATWQARTGSAHVPMQGGHHAP